MEDLDLIKIIISYGVCSAHIDILTNHTLQESWIYKLRDSVAYVSFRKGGLKNSGINCVLCQETYLKKDEIKEYNVNIDNY
ncbi:MAG: hypothetical protein AABY07_02925 [Nanoarchaeota archaeon]